MPIIENTNKMNGQIRVRPEKTYLVSYTDKTSLPILIIILSLLYIHEHKTHQYLCKCLNYFFFFQSNAPLEKSNGFTGIAPLLFLDSTNITCLWAIGSYLTCVISLAVLGTTNVRLYPVLAVDMS